MGDRIIYLKIRAWGCKIKSKIEADLTLENTKVKQGDPLNLKLVINFDPEDLPSALEISQDNLHQIQHFVLKKTIKPEISNSKLEQDIQFEYSGGEAGEYRIEVNFRQAEFGTELAVINPITFNLIIPAVEIAYCRTDVPRAAKGREFNIQVGINSPSPQKLRGIVFGRLISEDDLVHKMYELEPKRISIIDEKEIMWRMKVPHDEVKTGKYKAVIEFKSKDTFSKKEFEDFIEVRQTKLLRLNNITSSKSTVSFDDEIELTAEVINKGLENINIEIYPEVCIESKKTSVTVGKKESDRRDIVRTWPLLSKKFNLEPDTKHTFNWLWKVPKEVSTGNYNVKLHWKDMTTDEAGTFSRELFEVKKHHELKIINSIPNAESYSPGTEVTVKILLSDSGTRAGESIELVAEILDILNQVIHRFSTRLGIKEKTTEFDLHWQVPDELEEGKYDLLISLIPDGLSPVTRKFSKILNIELPVRLDLHLMLPKTLKPKFKFSRLLLENEDVLEKIEHNALSIYRLNSNTHIFLLNNELITYTKAKGSSHSELQPFINALFSYLMLSAL